MPIVWEGVALSNGGPPGKRAFRVCSLGTDRCRVHGCLRGRHLPPQHGLQERGSRQCTLRSGEKTHPALGGATWNVELVPTVINDGPTRTSALGNVSDALTLAGRNATVFLEYYHNGFGVGRGNFTLTSLPPDLADRLARGQLFDTRRDYLAAGLTLEVNPLLNVSPTLIVDLDDGSLFALVAATYSLSDNLNLIGGVQFPAGPAGTEFGGIPLAPGSQTLLSPARQIYLQIRKYF